jgi:hypothetical protein
MANSAISQLPLSAGANTNDLLVKDNQGTGPTQGMPLSQVLALQSIQTQNRFNLTLAGNTAGVLAQVSSGTLTLAGGNNVTLSQAGNAITISAANQTEQTQSRFNLTLAGNTLGVLALVSSGVMTLAGGANVTLSQAGNAITIVGAAGGAAGTNTIGMSTLGNTSGDNAPIAASAMRLILIGGNNVTLSQSTNGVSASITISAFNQSEQTQSRFNLTLAGNTSGVLAQVSSGVLTLAGGANVTLSQAGNAITISAAAGAQTEQTQNRFNLTLAGNTAGVLAQVSSGTLTLAGGNNVTLSQNGNAVTISAGGGAVPTLSWWQNMNIVNTGGMQVGSIAISYDTMGVYPLNQGGVFPGNMTVNTMHLLFTLSGSTATMSQAFTSSVFVAIYTLNVSTLSLLNSVVTTFGSGADNANLSTLRVGGRWLTIHSSAWSSQPVFTPGHYYVGLLIRSSSRSDQTAAYWGQADWSFNSVLSGSIGISQVNATTVGFQPWKGIYSVTTASPPTVISSNAINKQVGAMTVIPCIQFNNMIQSF